MSQLYTYDDAFSDVFGGGEKPDQGWDSAFNDVYGPKYVAGGPGGIPGAKDGLPTPQPDPWSFGAPGGEAPASQYGLDTIRSIMEFKKQVKAQGGDIDGKSDAEVLDLMRKFGPNPGATASDYQPQTTAADEFGRGLRRGIAYGLPVGLPGVEAMRENEQVQRAPEGFAGFAGQTLGGFSGLLDPGKAPENFGAIVFTGGVGRLAAGTLDVIGKNVAESLGKEAGARAVNMIREAIENAGQGGGMAALNELGNIPIDDWKSKPGESTMRVLKAAGIGAAAGMGLGAAFGAASKEARPVPRGTLPERVFDRMLTADEVQQARMGAASAQEGRGAMLDAANVYAAAPRANEMDPQIIAAARQADQMAMDQARASARAIDESTPAPAREPTPVQETSSEVPEAQGQGRQEGLLSPEQPAPEAKAPAVDYEATSPRYFEVARAVGEATNIKKAREAADLWNRYAPDDRKVSKVGGIRAIRQRITDGLTWAAYGDEGMRGRPSRIEAAEIPPKSPHEHPLSTPETPPIATRQPWEMTENDWSLSHADRLIAAGSSTVSREYTAAVLRNGGWHRRAVETALSEGRAVPPEVLKDYPDLAAKAKPPTPAEAGTTPAGTAAGQVEAPKASGKPTAQQIIAESSDKRSALQRILDQEDGPALWSDHQLIRPNGKYEIKDGKLVKVQDLSKTGFEKNLRDHIDAGEPGRWWNANRSALERMDQIRAEDEAKASAIQESRRIEREKQIAESNRQAEYRSELEAEVSGSRFSRKDVDVTFNDPNEPKKTVKMQVLGGIGVWKDPDGGYVATHVSSGKRLFAFDSLGKAKAFAVRASKIVDFSKSAEELVKSTDQYTYGLLSDAAKDPFSPPSTYKPIVDYPGTGQGTAQKEGSPGTTAKEAPEQPVPSTPKTSATAEPAVEPPASSPTKSSSENATAQAAQSAPESPRPERPASKDRQTSDDFTARRVVNKPEPGEPEGPVTSARNAMMDEDRFALGLDAADGPERRSWQSALDTAVARKIPDDALGIAAEVNAKPRPLDDIETAGLVYKANELKNRHRELMNEIGGTKDEAAIRDRAVKAARIEDEFDTLSTALRKAGTEQGRALASRKLTLREDYSLVAIKSRAKAAAGRELTPAENAKFEAMSKSLEDASTKIASLEKELADLKADSTIKRHAASKRGIPKETREKIIVDLAANVRQLIESGCR